MPEVTETITSDIDITVSCVGQVVTLSFALGTEADAEKFMANAVTGLAGGRWCIAGRLTEPPSRMN
jgi:hypothetical protein